MKARLRIAVGVLAPVLMAAVAWAGALDELPFAKKLKLAAVGDEEAQLAVAMAYETGSDAKADLPSAAKWYRKAAEQGNMEARFRLARIVQDGGQGLKKDPETAAKLYATAAEQGHAEAQNWLGYCYQHGIGLAPDEASAVKWYRRAADANLAIAQNNLGLMYLNGKGIARDYDEARKLFERAAAQGDSWGLNNLGGLHEMGWGVPQDKAKALDYYRQAKDKGNDNAGGNFARLTALLGPAAGQPTEAVKLPVAEPKQAEVPAGAKDFAKPAAEPKKTDAPADRQSTAENVTLPASPPKTDSSAD